MKNREPDWQGLKRIAERAEAAKLAGNMNYALWASLVREAVVASKGQGCAEMLWYYAQEGWPERLNEKRNKKKNKSLNRRAA